MNADPLATQVHAEQLLAATASFVSRDHGPDIHASLVAFLAQHLAVDYAHVALVEADGQSVRVVAGLLDGQPANAGYRYALTGTPCAQVLAKAHQCIARDVRSRFPDDPDLTALGAEAYIGEPLLGADGTPVGLIALVSRQALAESETRRHCLRILSAWASARLFRRQAEADHARDLRALAERQQLLRRVLDSAEEAIYGVDRNNLCTFANRACLRLLGLADENLLVGRDLHALIHHRYRDGTPYPPGDCRLHGAVHRGESVHSDQEVFWRSDGSCFPVEYWSHPILQEGRVAGAVVTFFDISTRRAHEQQVLLAELALRHLDAASYLVDASGRLREVSDAACRALGYRREQLLAMSIADVDPDVSIDLWQEIFAQRRQDAAVTHIETRHRRCDGTVFPVAVSTTYLEYLGEPLVIGLATDITQRKAAEAALRKLSLAVEQNPNTIFITRPDGQLEYVNAAFTVATGYTADEAIGQPVAMLRSPSTPAAAHEALWRTIRAGQAWRGEIVNRRKDGSEYPVYVHVAPLRQADGQVSHHVSIQEDITEKKRNAAELDRYRHHLEELLKERSGELLQANAELREARDVAEAASRAKSAFLANMSHEIRTPMNAITGMAHLLRRDGVTPRQKERLDKMEAAARHLLAILNDVLDLSKIEAGKLVLETQTFDVRNIVTGTAAMIQERAQAKGLSVSTECEPMPSPLLGDATRLTQALLNYAANAVKFTDRGRICLRVQKLSEDDASIVVRFEVEDSGIGIDPQVLPRLFQVFEQGDNSMTRRYGGSGLGLAITRRLALLMGGDAGVRSAPGSGSTFWFTARLPRAALPATGPGSSAEATEARLRLAHAGRRVLLVDDEPVCQEVAQELLTGAGLLVDVASSGNEALAMATRQHYALVLMDMQMPGMDGAVATRAIHGLAGRESLPVLALTANAYEEDRQRCQEAGMTGFVPKPIYPDQLYAAVLACLEAVPGAGQATIL